MRRVSAVLFTLLLVTSLPGAAVASDGGLGADTTVASTEGTAASHGESTASLANAAAGDEQVIHREFALRQLPERPGVFETELTVSVPDAVVDLEVTLLGEATVEETDGFEEAGEGTLEWTGSTDEPSVTYTLPANETGVDGVHGRTADGLDEEGDAAPGSRSVDRHGDGYYFVETGEWGIVKAPRTNVRWTETEPVTTERTVAVDGPGAAGTDVAVFGEVTEYTNVAGGEHHRLVVPDAATLVETPEDVLDGLAMAQARLPIGAENDELFVVAAPTGDVEWAPSGLQYGESDAWVRDNASLETAGNVWFHEYVHARQPFAGVGDGTTSETAWFVEGQAEYYAALLSLEGGYVDYDAFRTFLKRGQSSMFNQGVMVDPNSWADDRTDYARGPLVLGAIDREIRLATDGDRTLVDVVRDLNRGELPITRSGFLDTVERYGGADARSAALTYTETETVPDTWSRSEHRSTFDVETASFTAGLGEGEFRVSGEYREAAFADVPVIVPNETIALPVAVENDGDRAGAYDATLTVDGTIVDLQSGHLEVGESVVETVRWTPEEPGTYDVRVGDETIEATVSAPAAATVTDLRAVPRTADPGEPVTVVATVAADDDLPSRADLEVRTPAGVEDEHGVRLAPGETTTVESTLTFHREARHEVTVGERTTTVGIGTAAAMQERVAAATERVPGFGGAVAVIALFVTVGVLARRR